MTILNQDNDTKFQIRCQVIFPIFDVFLRTLLPKNRDRCFLVQSKKLEALFDNTTLTNILRNRDDRQFTLVIRSR